MGIYLVEGWTEPIDYQLLGDGGTPYSLSGLTVTVEAADRFDRAVTLTGTLTVIDAATGKVRFSPGATDLLHAKSPYRVRFKVTDGSGKKAFFPRAEREAWIVAKP